MVKAKALTENRQIRVFVSSTFRDMQLDRDYLVKFVFPQLRKLCESRGVTWSEVDLRWGITEEEAAEGKVLPLCLEEIQRCRPYFIGLLGERYGWVPKPDQIPADVLEREPWLKDYCEHSVTELEIIHGVLREEHMRRRAFFYFRDPNYVAKLPEKKRHNFITEDADSSEKLEQLKQRIREESNQNACELRENYRDPQQLGDWILEDFTRLINDLYPEGEQPGELEREAAEHQAFARRLSEVYIGRPEYFDRLDAHVADDGSPLVICGESGIGKSAFLANWFLNYQSQHPDAFTLIHFIGSTADSADTTRLMQRIMLELKQSFELPDEVPSTPDQIQEAFPQWLNNVAGREPTVLVLDSLNQLDNRDHAADLSWLPAVLPQNIKLIVSTLPGRSLEATQRRDWSEMSIQPLTVPERCELLEKFLAQYSRRLSPERVDEITSCEQTANPIFLRALLDELRQFGEHERLGEMISHYLAATDPGDLYRRILKRWELDYGSELVRDSLSLLWASRRGLSESELLDLLGDDEGLLPNANWTPFYLAAESILTQSSGMFRFSHDYIVDAVQAQYLPTEEAKKSCHLRLAGYWQQEEELSSRGLEELPWQWQQAKEWDRLKNLLTERSIFRRLRADERGKQDLQAYWLALQPHHDPCEAYRQAVDDWAADADSSESFANSLSSLGLFHKERAEFDAAEFSYRRALAVVEAEEGSQQLDVANILNNLAQLLQDTNRLSDAEPMMRRVLAIYEQAFGPEHPEVALGLNNLAALLQTTNQLEEAEQKFRRALAINEHHYGGKHQIVGSDLNNLAVLFKATGQLKDAEPLYRSALAIFEHALGGQHPHVAACLNNLATLLQETNQLQEAEPMLRRALAINEQRYGANHPYVADDLNSLAKLLAENGHLEDANWFYHRALDIVEQTYGDLHPSFGIQLSNLALFLQSNGRAAEAEPMLRRALAIHENSFGAEHPKVAVALVNLAKLLRTTNRLDEAEELYRRAVAIDEKSSSDQHPDVATRLNGLAALLHDTNRMAEAEPLIRRALSIYEDSYGSQHPKVAMGLSNLAQLLEATGRLTEAEPILRRALGIIENSHRADHPDYVACFNNLGTLLSHALANDEQAYGAQHPNVAVALDKLAEFLKSANRLKEAELLYRRAVAIEEQSNNDEQHDAAKRLYDLAELLLNTNRLSEAEPLYRHALSREEDVLGPVQFQEASILKSLALLIQVNSRVAEAEPLLRRALAINEQLHGSEHPNVGSDLIDLGKVLEETNRFAEAELFYRRALSINERIFGPENPIVAKGLNHVRRILQVTNRMSEAEQLLRRALEINEAAYGLEHPIVAIDLDNLAYLVQHTNRPAEAVPILRRAVEIFSFVLADEHPNTVSVIDNYRQLLTELELPPSVINQRLELARKKQGAYQPIAPEIERLLGPCKSVADILASLDAQYLEEGRLEIQFLKPDQAVTPCLERLLLPSPLSLNYQGLSKMRADSNAQAAAFFEAAYELGEQQANASNLNRVIRMNRAVAIRKLGGLELASKELALVASEMNRDKSQPDPSLARCLFHLAKCQYELGDTSKAIETIEQSFHAYENGPLDDPVRETHIEELQLLRQSLHAKTPPPQRVEVDIEAELSSARKWLKAIARLNSHPLNQPTEALLDQMLGPVASIAEVLARLEEQDRKEGKPPFYFLPIDEPLSPHLDELLGSVNP